MGWTIHYLVDLPGSWDEGTEGRTQDLLAQHQSGLTEGCEGLWLELIPHDRKEREPLTKKMVGAIERMLGTYAPGPSGLTFTPGEVDAARAYLWGFTKVHYSKDPEGDFRRVIEALQALATTEPSWTVRAADDYEFLPRWTDVRSVNVDDLELSGE